MPTPQTIFSREIRLSAVAAFGSAIMTGAGIATSILAAFGAAGAVALMGIAVASFRSRGPRVHWPAAKEFVLLWATFAIIFAIILLAVLWISDGNLSIGTIQDFGVGRLLGGCLLSGFCYAAYPTVESPNSPVLRFARMTAYPDHSTATFTRVHAVDQTQNIAVRVLCDAR